MNRDWIVKEDHEQSIEYHDHPDYPNHVAIIRWDGKVDFTEIDGWEAGPPAMPGCSQGFDIWNIDRMIGVLQDIKQLGIQKFGKDWK